MGKPSISENSKLTQEMMGQVDSENPLEETRARFRGIRERTEKELDTVNAKLAPLIKIKEELEARVRRMSQLELHPPEQMRTRVIQLQDKSKVAILAPVDMSNRSKQQETNSYFWIEFSHLYYGEGPHIQKFIFDLTKIQNIGEIEKDEIGQADFRLSHVPENKLAIIASPELRKQLEELFRFPNQIKASYVQSEEEAIELLEINSQQT